MSLALFPGVARVSYCLPHDPEPPVSLYNVTDDLLSSRGISRGAVLVTRQIEGPEIPPEGSVAVVAVFGSTCAKVISYSSSGVTLTDDTGSRSLTFQEVQVRTVALHACYHSPEGACLKRVELRRRAITPFALTEGESVFWEANPMGLVVKVGGNWEAHFGITGNEARGNNYLNVIHPEDRGLALSGWGRAILTNAPFYCSVRVWARDRYIPCVAEAYPLYNREGIVRAWEGVTQIHYQAVRSDVA